MAINYYKGRVCLNVLGGSLRNAREIYDAAEGHVEVGVLTADYPDVVTCVDDMSKYMEALDGNLSVGLGGGNPKQCYMVAEVAKSIKANHFNQVFCEVSATRANVGNDDCHINAMVAPSGHPGLIRISTGPISKDCPEPALVPADTAIAMVKEMGETRSSSSLWADSSAGMSCELLLNAVRAMSSSLSRRVEYPSTTSRRS